LAVVTFATSLMSTPFSSATFAAIRGM